MPGRSIAHFKHPRLQGEIRGWWFLATAALLLVVSGGITAIKAHAISTLTETEGRVVSNREAVQRRKNGEITVYYPLVAFLAPSDGPVGRTYRIEADDYTLEPLPEGAPIPVYYPDNMPAAAIVAGDDYWSLPLGLFVLAIVFGAIGLTFITITRWAEYCWPGSMKRQSGWAW
jgi:hypothetical protein